MKYCKQESQAWLSTRVHLCYDTLQRASQTELGKEALWNSDSFQEVWQDMEWMRREMEEEESIGENSVKGA